MPIETEFEEMPEAPFTLRSDVSVMRSHVNGERLARAVDSTVNIGRALSGFRRHLYHTSYPEKHGHLFDLVMLLYVGNLLDSGEVVPLDDHAANKIRDFAQRVRAGSMHDALSWLHSESRLQIHALADSEYFVMPDKSKLAERNPYVACGCATQYSRLKFLTEEHGFDADLVNARRASEVEDLSEEEIVLFLHAGHSHESPLSKLMRPLPFLTHLENVRVALQHARLFLLGAQLPVALGVDVTYADLKHLLGTCVFPQCQAGKYMPARNEDIVSKWYCWKRPLFTWLDDFERLPSGVETSLRLLTISMHGLAKKLPGTLVVHDSSAGCPPQAPLFVKRLLRLKSPLCINPEKDEPRDWKYYNGLLVDSQEEDECDALDQATYTEWEFGESKEMFALLTRF